MPRSASGLSPGIPLYAVHESMGLVSMGKREEARASGRFVPGRVASLCALAPPEVARRCFERLRGLIAGGHFPEDPRMPSTNMRNLLPEAFDRAGEVELAEHIDEQMLSSKGPFNGVGLAHFRKAKRLLARGERPRGEELGRRIINAWSMVDVPVPGVAQMRALLAKR